MNEAFSQTDIDDGKPSLYKCLYRGLREELNIKENLSFSNAPKFLDLIFNLDRFEIGLTSVISFPNLSFEELRSRYKTAPDGRLETYDLKMIGLNEQSVGDFLSTYEMTSGSELALHLLLARSVTGNLSKASL